MPVVDDIELQDWLREARRRPSGKTRQAHRRFAMAARLRRHAVVAGVHAAERCPCGRRHLEVITPEAGTVEAAV